MKYIVTFKERVKHDYNCRWKTNADHSIRFDSYEEARKAAKQFCKEIPKLPYTREATVFNGPLITCQWSEFMESKILKYTGSTAAYKKAPAKFNQFFNMIF